MFQLSEVRAGGDEAEAATLCHFKHEDHPQAYHDTKTFVFHVLDSLVLRLLKRFGVLECVEQGFVAKSRLPVVQILRQLVGFH